MSDESGPPVLPHLSSEFFVWLWFAAERDGGQMNLGEDLGIVDAWVDERISFRTPNEDKVRAVVTGENTATALEARAALAGGKVVRDVQLHLRRAEREYQITLRGAHLDLAGARLPSHSPEGVDELLYERMFLYEELWHVVRGLYRRFAMERTAETWRSETLPAMRAWIGGAPAREAALAGTEDAGY
jgi:hypothetical protein